MKRRCRGTTNVRGATALAQRLLVVAVAVEESTVQISAHDVGVSGR